ncbi:hypothetical protein NMY22_g20222 [Coprinellus aureogranulatus]|nr:hypothetical protein NMY22_g20222 [Coprinellus aureogranulatus]
MDPVELGPRSLLLFLEDWPLLPVYVLETAVRLQPNDPESWRDLGWSYYGLDDYTDDAEFMDRAVKAHEHAVAAGEIAGYSDQPELLTALGTSLLGRFQRTWTPEDIHRSIDMHEKALIHRPEGHPKRRTVLCNLAASVGYRFDNGLGSDNDLERGISLSKEAISLSSPGDQERTHGLGNLATLLFRLFEKTGKLEHLDESISTYEEAFALFPSGHSGRAILMSNLAERLHLRFEKREAQDMEDLFKSIQLLKDSLDMRHLGHPQRPQSLVSLALALYCWFENHGPPEAVALAIVYHQEALGLWAAGLVGSTWDRGNCLSALHCLRGSVKLKAEKCWRAQQWRGKAV